MTWSVLRLPCGGSVLPSARGSLVTQTAVLQPALLSAQTSKNTKTLGRLTIHFFHSVDYLELHMYYLYEADSPRVDDRLISRHLKAENRTSCSHFIFCSLYLPPNHIFLVRLPIITHKNVRMCIFTLGNNFLQEEKGVQCRRSGGV